MGGTAVAQAPPEDPDLCIGRPVAFHPEIRPPPPPDHLDPGQPDSARPAVGGPNAFQSPSIARWRHLDTGGMWWVTAKDFRASHISMTLTAPVHGRQSYRKLARGFRTMFPTSPPEQRLEQLKLGSKRVRFDTCWYRRNEVTPAYIRAFQRHTCNLSFKFRTVPRPTFCWIVWLQEEQARKKAAKHVTSLPRILRKARQCRHD